MGTKWSLSRLAAKTVDIAGAFARAKATGLTDATFEYYYYDAKRWCRITCERPMAEFLACELKQAARDASTAEARAECAAGSAAVRLAIALEQMSWAPPRPRGGLEG
jgi:hypothetical protein